jgi:hypothetical protein
LCDDILLEVLAFLHFQAIVAGDGVNTASWLISTLISRHHPTAKKLFAKQPRVVGGRGGKLEIERLWADKGCWHVWIDDDGRRRRMPLPLMSASQEIVGLGNVCLPTRTTPNIFCDIYRTGVCFSATIAR